MSEKIVISITSYPKRIGNVGKTIFLILTKQTRKPDEIHLWLAEPEFPNKERDLPDDLTTIITTVPNVFLHWLPKNTYAHKKHEYFKCAADNDCVFLLDDDVRYSDDLIEKVMSAHEKFSNAVIAFNHYSAHIYYGRKIVYVNPKTGWNVPRYDTRLCTQCMIPAGIYPKEALTDENQNIRDRICPVCDETWLNPFLVYANIPIFHFNYDWGIDISKSASHYDGLCVYTHVKESNGYERRDNWLYAVLEAFPKFKDDYRKKFNYNV